MVNSKVEIETLADFIVWQAKKFSRPISYLELQKIIYLLNKKYFERYSSFLVDESFYTAPYGVINYKVKKMYHSYGAMNISCFFKKEPLLNISPKRTLFIRNIIECYLYLSPLELLNIVKSDIDVKNTIEENGYYALIALGEI